MVWDNTTQYVGAIPSSEAVPLIETILSKDEWKTVGIPVIERVIYFQSALYPTPKHTKKYAAEPEPPTEKPKTEVHEEERLRLTGAAAEQFYTFLRTRESTLRSIVADHERRGQEAIRNVWELWLRSKNDQEANEIELAGRLFPWQPCREWRVCGRHVA